ncbi:hypothetical protein FSP39_012520 [Pinctada imbricata]|uniref:Nuclear pore complex protein Nup85 n=1 Tax=Pinctada imbricata TaxID=66713 RepID=A0AA88XYN3_PINIB|nr:hypothetical protein FSP39_012520 [Pinctada imbricata]
MIVDTFMELQRKSSETMAAAFHAHILEASKKYRATLFNYSRNLQKLINSTGDLNQKKLLDDHLMSLQNSELIWSLCEILFIDNHAGGLVITQLLGWIRMHFEEPDQMYRSIIVEERPEDQYKYWDCIYCLVLQGQVDEARRLLSKHSCYSTEGFQTVDNLLRRMPLLTHLSRGSSVAEFDMKWRHWREECENRLRQQEFVTNRNLSIIVQILSGDDTVFTDLKDLCQTWYHMLVSKLLYQQPTIQASDLHHHVQSCLDEYRSNNSRISEVDNILILALEFDIHQVIKDSCTLSSNWWFVAHLTDLLQHCGQLETRRLQFGSNLREFLLLEYAGTLMSHKTLWIVGIHYLDHCPEFGRRHQELYLESLPIETEMKAQKLFNICQERNMTDQAKSICKVVGMRHLKNNRLGAALSWFLKSKDVALATVLAEKFLSEYSESGRFSNLDLIDNLGSSMLLSNKLTFLGKYREFHKLFEEGDSHAAGSLLLSLLQARLAPKQFWMTLFIDVIPLLLAEEIIFNAQQTFELMHCLEELITEYRVFRRTTMTPSEEEKLSLLREALTQNLSRAIITEGTIRIGLIMNVERNILYKVFPI